ncbi:MAG: hypothetical protein LBI60_01645 [Bacteroidales bacterium]|nr:hypothetical protein [Bacteroidales bacterium]
MTAFCRATTTSFPPNFNNKITSVAKEINIHFNLITSLELRITNYEYTVKGISKPYQRWFAVVGRTRRFAPTQP